MTYRNIILLTPVVSLLTSGLVSGCVHKNPDETSGEAGTTEDALDTTWALGAYYQPIQSNYATNEKSSINIREDFTAQLDREFCDSGQGFSQTVRWLALDETTLEFTSLQGEPFLWFGAKPYGAVRLRRTDNSNIVIVSDGPSEMGATLGEFRRGVGCLRITDPFLGCFGGAFVKPCEEEATSG